jgi:hypothetical protein
MASQRRKAVSAALLLTIAEGSTTLQSKIAASFSAMRRQLEAYTVPSPLER